MDQHTHHQVPRYVEPQPRNGFGITALVLALVGVVFGLIPITGFLAVALGALAVLFGVLGYARARRGIATNSGMSIVSTILGVGVVALGIWGMSIVGDTLDQLDKDLGEISGDTSGPDPVTGQIRPEAHGDVKITGCEAREDYGMYQAEATLTITNRLDQAASYMITVAVDGAGGQRLGEIHAMRDQLAPGQTAELSGVEASTLLDNIPGVITCSVVDVDRMAF